MSSDSRLVWSDQEGDLRKSKADKSSNQSVDEKNLVLLIKRVTSGKGRTAIIISGLPNNKKWCQKLTKSLKKSLAAGGAYKNDSIEVHGEQLDRVISYLDSQGISWKKIGG